VRGDDGIFFAFLRPPGFTQRIPGNMLSYTAKMALFFLSSHGEDVNIFHFRVEHKNKQQTKCEIHAKK
jgi:hypothetical protein